MKTTINDRIRQLREAAGKTQQDFALDVGISVSLLSKIEVGDKEVTRKIYDKIARSYSVSESWLTNGSGKLEYKVPLRTGGSPWENEAFVEIRERNRDLKAEVEFYRDLLRQFAAGFAGGKASGFLKLINRKSASLDPVYVTGTDGLMGSRP